MTCDLAVTLYMFHGSNTLFIPNVSTPTEVYFIVVCPKQSSPELSVERLHVLGCK